MFSVTPQAFRKMRKDFKRNGLIFRKKIPPPFNCKQKNDQYSGLSSLDDTPLGFPATLPP